MKSRMEIQKQKQKKRVKKVSFNATSVNYSFLDCAHILLDSPQIYINPLADL